RMARKFLMTTAAFMALTLDATSASAAPGRGSVFLTAPADPAAITVKAVADGKADDTAAIQSAIDAAAKSGAGGIVWLPAGRYRISRSLLIPPAVRVFGVGATRPVLVLGDNTPGFDKGVATMVIFTGDDQYATGPVPVPVPTAVPYSAKVRDANSGTFYSALSNVDFEIGKGDPAAAGVRLRIAQHAFLAISIST